MKLTNIKIKNFKSLKEMDVDLNSNKNLVIGKNNSGKSNFLECIGMMLKPGRSGMNLPAFNSELNHESKYLNPKEPIEIEVRFDITDSLANLPEEVKVYSFQEVGRTFLVLSLEKKINEDGFFYIGNTNVTFPEYVKTSRYIYFNCIIVDTDRKFDKNINSDTCSSIFGTILSNMIGAFIEANKGKLLDISKESDENFSNNFCKMLTLWFEKQIIVDSTFDEVRRVLFKHKHCIKCETLDFINNGFITFDYLEKILKKLSILMDDGNLQEINLKGMGIQSTFLISLILKCNMFFRVPPIICIDEVELHLHPQAQRRFNSILNDLSSKNQLILTTHSPIFITETDIFKLILFKKEEYTSLSQVGNRENLNEDIVKRELNEFNSEMFFASAVMLVEGLTDKLFFRYIANNCLSQEYNFDKNNISVIPIGSKDNGRIYLQILNEFNIPYFVLLDKGGENQIKKLERINRYSNNLVSLKKGEIEDYYSEELIIKIKLKEVPNVKDLLADKLNNKPNKKTIEKAWKKMILDHLEDFPKNRFKELSKEDQNRLNKDISKWFSKALNELVADKDFEVEPRRKYQILASIFGSIGKPRLALTLLNYMEDEKYLDSEIIDIIVRVVDLSKHQRSKG